MPAKTFATFVNRRRDGSLFHAEQSISPVADEKGRITHYVSVTKDISARVEKERSLIHDASHDTLTDLYNRRFGEQLLSSAYLTARGHGSSLCLVLCDIDHFKRVNDRYGHPTGDRIIVNVANAMKQTVRGNDAVIRWGGEEFLILLENCPLEPGEQLAERIRSRVEALGDAEVGQVTLSLGLAAFPDGHPKLPHLWPVKLLQAGRLDYDDSGLMAMRAAASLRR